MVHDQARLRTLLPQLEFHNRIESLRPHGNAPRLDNAVIGQKLNVSPRDYSTETRKSAARIAADLRRRTTGEFAELLGIQERVINTLGTRLEDDFLLYRVGHKDPLGL